jgi:hypothetical protein
MLSARLRKSAMTTAAARRPRLSLSSKGMERFTGTSLNYDNNFTFILGADRYSCPSFVAEFLSPRVSFLRSEDSTVDEFVVKTLDPDHLFTAVLSLGFGGALDMDRGRVRFLRSIFSELGNSELFELTFDASEEPVQIAREDLLSRLFFFSESGGDCERDLHFVASHFYEFSLSDFDNFSFVVLERILSDGSLVVKSEDCIFDLIHRRASRDLSFFPLLEYLRFEFISKRCMETAFAFIRDSFPLLSIGIWDSLANRLFLPAPSSTKFDRFDIPLPAFDSKIITSCPDIFADFGGKQLRLLYRGSRDGFGASDFHRLCDGHKGILTVIQSSEDYVFGGYTSLAFRSQYNGEHDASKRTYVWTLKNPHNLPPQIFPQKTQFVGIQDYPHCGPSFGRPDLYVLDRGNATDQNSSNLSQFVNDSGIAGHEVLTGARHFVVKEIEVFQVI